MLDTTSPMGGNKNKKNKLVIKEEWLNEI